MNFSYHASDKILYVFLVLLAFGLVTCDVATRVAVVGAATRVQTSDLAHGAQEVSPLARQRWTVLPSSALDARWWVIHAEKGLQGERIRSTNLDNSPVGREVHWSSGPVWLLAAIARTLSVFSESPPLEEVQHAPLWFGPIVFLILAFAVSALIGPRFGWGYPGFLILIFSTSFPVYEAFRSGDADHHGLLTIFALSCVVCLVCGGVGWLAPEKMKGTCHGGPPIPHQKDARKYFILSAICGSTGLWISAVTMIPVIIGCGVGAIVASWLRPGERFFPKPDLWRLWGIWGCFGSLGFYLLEYFPTNMGWRLEVNHPLYALAWLAGGEGLMRITRKISGSRFVDHTFSDAAICIGAICSALLVPCLIYFNRVSWMMLSDPFLLALHQEHIREFSSLWEFVHWKGSWLDFIEYLVWPGFALATLPVGLWLATPGKPWHPVLGFSFVVAGVIQILALVQVRWSGLSIMLWSVCILVLLVMLMEKQSRDRIPRWILAALAGWMLVGILPFSYLTVRGATRLESVSSNLPQSLVPTILLRDISHRLIQATPDRLPVVLADPTSSTELAYYAGIRTIGTLYWENLPGLRRSAEIFSEPSEEVVYSLLKSSGVTYIVVPSWDDFSDLSAYSRLLGRSTPSYLQKILDGKAHPTWLQEYPYPIPETFGIPNETIRVFKVLPRT